MSRSRARSWEKIQRSVEPEPLTPAAVAREFKRLLDDGAPFLCAGGARKDPTLLLRRGYTPKHRVDLFGTRYYVSNVRQNPLLRFFVGYVVQEIDGRPTVYARIFYKDISLIWRSGSHLVRNEHEMWVGKGEVERVERDGWEHYETRESTTDLPLEVQSAFEDMSRRVNRVPRDEEALALVLRNAPPGRVDPYEDFLAPRRAARADRRHLIHGGRPIARFTRKGDPSSLRFVAGYEPDFAHGVVEQSESYSASYGGRLRRFRILSRNAHVQYLFFAGPHHAWVIPPQALTTVLSSYGVRLIDVRVDDDMCVPGYEYHFLQHPDDPDSLHSQIPEGYAGAPNPRDPDRADASAWIDRLPVVQEFRRRLLR